MKQTNFPRRKKARQEQAEVRNSVYAGLSVAQKIAALDSKFGKGQGAKRERARLTSGKVAKAEAVAKPKKEPLEKAMKVIADSNLPTHEPQHTNLST